MLTVSEIQRRVAARYGLRFEDMRSPDRRFAISRPRQVAMVLARRLTHHSRRRVGTWFGGRDNTTVLHAERAVETRRQVDAALDRTIRLLTLDLLAPLHEAPESPVEEFLILAGTAIRRDALPSFPRAGAV